MGQGGFEGQIQRQVQHQGQDQGQCQGQDHCCSYGWSFRYVSYITSEAAVVAWGTVRGTRHNRLRFG